MPDNMGAAGVRFEVIDNSTFVDVSTPRDVAGVVGFSTKGPFNTIINLPGFASIDNVLGRSGFSDSRYNAGLLAARSATLAGASVDFVRLYNEPTKLRSDAWITFLNEDGVSGSEDSDTLSTEYYFASNSSTITDGYLAWGNRYINPITDVVATGQRVNFSVDTGRIGNKIPLFSVIPVDASSTRRTILEGATATADEKVAITSQNDYVRVTIPKTLTYFNNGVVKIGTISDLATTTNARTVKFTFSNGVSYEFVLPTNLTGALAFENLVAQLATQDWFLGSVVNLDTEYYIEYANVQLTSLESKTTGAYAAVASASIYTAPEKVSVRKISYTSATLTTSYDIFGESSATISGTWNEKLATILPKLRASRYVSDIETTADSLSYTLVSYAVDATTDAEQFPYYTSNVISDYNFGLEFSSLGLADELVMPSVYSRSSKMFVANEKGATVIGAYVQVQVRFDGNIRSFAGTLVPMSAGDVNLYIMEQTYAYANEFAFIIPDQGVLEDMLYDGYQLSATSTSSTSGATQDVTYDSIVTYATIKQEDKNHVWVYNPKNNRDTSGLAAAWNLFLDKDASDVFLLVSAGANIKNLYLRNREALDVDVMRSMLNVCELRKDCVAIFDAPDYESVSEVIRKTSSANFATELARWGAIYDGRDIVLDSYYTNTTIEQLKTINVANRFLANMRGGKWWLPCAGYDQGGLSGNFVGKGQKYRRTYNYSADPNSDIAKLYDARINPTRVTQGGFYLYGQKTFVVQASAFQRFNISALIAGIHKRFERILDRKVFHLNTRELREEIRSVLQAEINFIIQSNPSGLISGRVICDETNNTPDVIRRRQLIVDLTNLSANEAAEFITVRTTISQSGGQNNVTSELI